MESKRPQILLSNDDGYDAKGINELIKYLRPLADLVVMAPDSARSGMSAAITADKPVRYSLVSKEEGVTIYKCSGTPVDCVKIAWSDLPDFRPDMVIGGINHGDNSAVNVHYSGTMGIVIEGCLKGIPSIGYSLCDHDKDADFSHTCRYIQGLTAEVLEKGLPTGVCLNVNFPQANELKGVRVCRQTKGAWENEWCKCKRPNGGNYFWLTGDFVSHEPANEETDQWALAHGYVAITPVQIDLTAYRFIEEINNWETVNSL